MLGVWWGAGVVGGVVREERRGGGGGQPPTSCCGGAGPPEQPFFQTYRRLANAFAPTGCVGGFPGPVGSVGKMRQMHILVGCIKSVCVRNAFAMRSEMRSKHVECVLPSSPILGQFWGISCQVGLSQSHIRHPDPNFCCSGAGLGLLCPL